MFTKLEISRTCPAIRKLQYFTFQQELRTINYELSTMTQVHFTHNRLLAISMHKYFSFSLCSFPLFAKLRFKTPYCMEKKTYIIPFVGSYVAVET